MKRVALDVVVVFALAAATCAPGRVAPTPFGAMPTPLGGERAAPADVFVGPAASNGCDEALGPAGGYGPVEVLFGGQVGERYRPRCVAVPVGTRVLFRGDFSRHPMAGGVVVAGQAYRDPSSVVPFTSAGGEAAFVPVKPGVYPFFCQVHWVLGMSGAVIVR